MIKKQKQEIQKTKLEEVKCNLKDEQRHAVTLVSEKGASSVFLIVITSGNAVYQLYTIHIAIGG